MALRLAALIGLGVIGHAQHAKGDWVQWPTLAGGNGHYYQVVTLITPVSWEDARDHGSAVGGYLATITSAPENAFVYSTVANAVPSAWGPVGLLEYGPWLGGAQPSGSPEPAGGWTWVTGEAFAYTNWNTDSEPNDLDGIEDKLHFHARWAPAGTWNDLQTSGEGRIFSYVIEQDSLSGVTCPTMSGWGLISLTLSTLAAGTTVLIRSQRVHQ